MPSTTPTLSLSVYNDSTDGTELFSNFRADIAGDAVSNMTIIDDWADGVNTDISTLQLSQPINYVYATVTASPADYISTVAAIISYVTNMIIVLRLDIGNASSSTTLNINGLGSKNLMKYVAGSPVNINANDLRINKDYLFRYDGTRWVWVNAVSGDQLSVSGTSGDIIKISSVNGIETASTAITNLTLLLGRSGGQTISGGIVSDEILTLTGNSYGSGNTDTKPSIQFKVGDAPSTAATILNSGYLGLGTATPSTLLHIATSTTAAGSSTLEQASADADSFDIAFKKTRGTISSPTVITTGDELGTIQFSGYSGAGGYVVGAAIKSISSGTIATTRIPSQLSFWTGTDAAPTVLTERMTIKNDGKVGIATNAPSEMLHVVGNARVTGLTGGVVKTDANGLMSNIVLAGDTTKFLNENGVFSIAGHSIEDEGSAVTARATLNFVGAGVTVADVSSKTTVTIPRYDDGWIPGTGTWTYSSGVPAGSQIVDRAFTSIGGAGDNVEIHLADTSGFYVGDSIVVSSTISTVVRHESAIITAINNNHSIVVNALALTHSTTTPKLFRQKNAQFVVSVNADVTGIINVGMKIKLTHATVKYFIVTAVGAYGGGVTLITLYGGTDYTLAVAGDAITLPYYSTMKTPFGFPTSPLKWSVIITDVTERSQATPAAIWYNMGNVYIHVPIGEWRLSYFLCFSAARTTATSIQLLNTLSTVDNNTSNKEFWVYAQFNAGSATLALAMPVTATNIISLAAKTDWYILYQTGGNGTAGTLYSTNDSSTLTLMAECAYL